MSRPEIWTQKQEKRSCGCSMSCTIRGNTIVLITHDEGVALQAERRIAIFDGHVREVME